MRKTKATVLAEAAERVRISEALHWTDASDIAPDVPPPEGWDELTTGWTFNAYSRRVEIACSSYGLHAVGRTDKATSQKPIALYSTKARALRALRCALEQEFATELAKIDEELGDT